MAFSRRLATVVLATLAILFAAVGVASASPAAAGLTVVTLNSVSYHVPAATAHKVTSGHPELLTNAEEASLGIHHGTRSSDAPTVTRGGGGTVQPDSVNRCSGQVCIEVQGSGLHIIEWNSQWYQSPNLYSCDESWDWWGNFTHYSESLPRCGYGSDYAYWTPNRNFPAGAAQSYFYSDTRSQYSSKVNFTIHS